ncbi:MAG: TRAP transporter large permease subunit [Ketobacteraceae bacterium]|nr:TRAP transporter large permease subunit [Ketobacteraceae bacterium]
MGYSQLLKLGEFLWKDYYILRGDIPTPTCDPNPDIDAELQKVLAEKESQDDEFGDLFGEPEDNTEALRESLQKQASLCQEKHRIAEENQARVTDTVRMFRQVDYFLLKVSEFGRENQRLFLGLMLFFCAITTTLTKHHIGLRLMTTQLDFRVGSIVMTIANAAVTYSAYWFLSNGYASGTEMLHAEIRWLYLIGFGSLTLVTLVQCFQKPPSDLEPGGTMSKAFLSVPLYAYMALISANFYIIQESNPQGMVLFVDKIMDAADMFMKIGLYIWIGMLLKQTYIGELVFSIFKPWRLPPEMLAFTAVVLMAVPTAYTGASGIIVIAMGAVVYNELRRAGARRQLALAATAMTGSLGVVLRPCLLVVIIAALNKEVTTDQLFGWGVKIFMLTSVLFLIISLLGKESKFTMAPVSEALAPSLNAFKPLIPYAMVFALVAVLYAVIFDAYLDEFSAPTILPVIILALVIYEKLMGKPHLKYHQEGDDEREVKVEPAVRVATTDTTVHIGALLTVMALGITVGGVIEDSGFVSGLAEQGELFSSQWTTMAFLCLALVLIGMSMDAFAAVILVSGSIAQLAYQQGIDPLHFWMLVLVAFELGYLTPPVAINHLLTRQVVGEEEFEKSKEEVQGRGFWRRHERLLLPLAVMFTAMLIVAFAPLIYTGT